MSTNPADLGILAASELLRNRRLSAVELVETCLQRIDQRNGGPPTFDGAPNAVNAWVRLYPELAVEQARAAELRLEREGDAAPRLCGIPLAMKDLYAIAGLPLTASSRVLEGNVATEDATVWRRLRDCGMVAVGHTHTHEFAAGGTTDQVGNPWALDTVAGGSSGGSAASLAASMVPAGLGTDTCGSLRIPSACCGTSAIKPTHGRLPLDGIIPLGFSLDHPGPIARSIADCSALLSGMIGSPRSTLPVAPRTGPRPLEGMRIAISDRTGEMTINPEVVDGFARAITALRMLGGSVVEIGSPARLDWDDLSTVLLSEVWAYHSQFRGRHEHYRPAIAEFVEAASAFTDAQAYIRAQQRRARLTWAWEEWFATHQLDLLIEPTLPVTPGPRGDGYERGHAGGPGDPMIALTALWDMTGMPVATLPVSWNVGISLVARRGAEPTLIQAAIDLQQHELGEPQWPRGGQ
jgi:aspartyl-tRNA(Asn)/glutamyl-tRNA(Gln) amidotransferase subunit A